MKEGARARERSHQQQLTEIKHENSHFLSLNNRIKAIFIAIAISNGGERDRQSLHPFCKTILFYHLCVYTLIMFALVRMCIARNSVSR